MTIEAPAAALESKKNWLPNRIMCPGFGLVGLATGIRIAAQYRNSVEVIRWSYAIELAALLVLLAAFWLLFGFLRKIRVVRPAVGLRVIFASSWGGTAIIGFAWIALSPMSVVPSAQLAYLVGISVAIGVASVGIVQTIHDS